MSGHSVLSLGKKYPLISLICLCLLVLKKNALYIQCVFFIFWTPSMEFSRQEYWSEFPFPSSGDLPNPGLEPGSPALQVDSLPTELLGKPKVLKVAPKLTPLAISSAIYHAQYVTMSHGVTAKGSYLINCPWSIFTEFLWCGRCLIGIRDTSVDKTQRQLIFWGVELDHKENCVCPHNFVCVCLTWSCYGEKNKRG